MSSHSSTSTRAVSPAKGERKKEESVEMKDLEKADSGKPVAAEEKAPKRSKL